MNKTFSWLLASLIPLSVGCLEDVALADRSDGGFGDAPAIDAPAADAPPAVCAACGGASSPSCLYAPGCGNPQRVCAPNTCGDAIAIPFCGCDGQTHYSGCITPDRAFLHAGPCGDGGAAPADVPASSTDAPADAPASSTDAPVADAPPPVYCPVELDQNTAQYPDLLYPRALVRTPPDTAAAFPMSTTYEVRGRWLAPRRLATPIDQRCVDAVAADPACRPDAVIRVQPDGDGGAPVEFVTSVAFDALPAVPAETAVVLRLEPTLSFPPLLSPTNVVLSVRRASDDALYLVVANTARLPASVAEPWTFGPVQLRRGADPACISRPEPMCRRTFGAYPLEVTGLPGDGVLPPRASGVVAGAAGRFRVRNLLQMHRIPGTGAECADLAPDVFSFEIVRQPDA